MIQWTNILQLIIGLGIIAGFIFLVSLSLG